MDMRQTPYYKIYADVYGLLSRNLPVRCDDDAYWDAAIKDADTLYRAYNQNDAPGNAYARKLILETMDELERISKRGGRT